MNIVILNMASKQQIRQYYDDLATQQDARGINMRHRYIMANLRRMGLQRDHRVLEIGCGVGTVTELLANFITRGSIFGLDISQESIEYARRRLASYTHVKLAVCDVAELQTADQFNVILLPDVLEHIPIAEHAALFGRLPQFLKNDGFVFIHIPDPKYLRYLRDNKREILQIVDQPIEMEHLVDSLRGTDLEIAHVESYSVWVSPADYRFIVLRPRMSISDYRSFRPSFRNRLARRALTFLYGLESQ